MIDFVPTWHKVILFFKKYMSNKGIVCKVWNIHGDTVSKSASAQLGDSIGYILDEERTECKLKMDSASINDPLGQLGRECKYVQDDIKTVAGAYAGSRNIRSTDIKGAVAEMMEVKKFYEKTDGRAALHGMISLCEEESDVKNAALLLSLCRDVLEELFPNHQAVFGVHTNTDNLHVHFIINSVGLDGRKIHQDDKFIEKVLQPAINKYARKYGFTPNAEWEKEEKEAKKNYAELKISLRKAIDMAIEQSHDFDEFICCLEKKGYTVNVGKYISLKNDEMKKAIRTHNLGTYYSKEAILERIANKYQSFANPEINDYVADEDIGSVFTPINMQMKKYSEMGPVQKEYVLKQIRLGRNPWREHKKRNWQLNQIAEELNLQNRVIHYVNHYSDNGTLQGALDGIIEAKRKINNEKRIIVNQKRKYKAILDIYEEMQQIEKRAYLYEHENIAEYRTEFENYRLLTRRLKDGYGKDVFEVANFVEECKERLLYAHAQLNELSQQYREIKKYTLQNGERKQVKDKNSLIDVIDFYESKKDEKMRIYEADIFYIVSENNRDFFIRVTKTPVSVSGRLMEDYTLEVVDKHGEVVEKIGNRDNIRDFPQYVHRLQEKYDFSDKLLRFESMDDVKNHIQTNFSYQENIKNKSFGKRV